MADIQQRSQTENRKQKTEKQQMADKLKA